jgi:hypothetical protein
MLGWPRLANVLEGAAVFSGFAVLLFPLLAALYGLTRFLMRRRATHGWYHRLSSVGSPHRHLRQATGVTVLYKKISHLP